jgi:hypothetical protein
MRNKLIASALFLGVTLLAQPLSAASPLVPVIAAPSSVNSDIEFMVSSSAPALPFATGVANQVDPSGVEVVFQFSSGSGLWQSSSSSYYLELTITEGAAPPAPMLKFLSGESSYGRRTPSYGEIAPYLVGTATPWVSVEKGVWRYDLTGYHHGDQLTGMINAGNLQEFGVVGVTLNSVPEPSSAALLGFGVFALILHRRKVV